MENVIAEKQVRDSARSAQRRARLWL